ncbi:MAG: N-6 DNA methylase [Nitrospirota bacterium]
MISDFEKLRGGYYTPSKIAKWICDWAIRTKEDRVLEPSCGDGIFLEFAAKRLMNLGGKVSDLKRQIYGIELVADESNKTNKRINIAFADKKARFEFCRTADFFSWNEENPSEKFSSIVGNPPFIRYQNFPEPSRSKAMTLMKKAGLKPNKLTNIWLPFVVGATELLKPNGRLAFVLPAELLQVSYAQQLRAYLVDNFKNLKILTCNELLFENAEQEVVLFLADYKRQEASKTQKTYIDFLVSDNKQDMLSLKPLNGLLKCSNKVVNHDTEKWTKYFLTQKEISFIRALRQAKEIVELGHHAKVDVGVVTGKNDYFVLDEGTVNKFDLQDFVFPIVGRASQLRGVILKNKELGELAKEGNKLFLFYKDFSITQNIPEAVKRYIKEGEKQGVHLGYKCSIRKLWYHVPSVWKPDFYLFRQIYNFPRIVFNNTPATSTDTIHRMKTTADYKLLINTYYTHLTAASAEIEGRSYGGGVLELEPTEAEKLLIPKELNNGFPIEEMDNLVRSGRVNELLEINDRNILINRVGLSKDDCKLLKGIWTKLKERRLSRKQ